MWYGGLSRVGMWCAGLRLVESVWWEVVLDCWEMSVVRYVRLHGFMLCCQSTFSFRLLISLFEQHKGFILILFFILHLFNSFNSFPPFPLVGFRHRTNALGYRRSWRWSSPLSILAWAPWGQRIQRFKEEVSSQSQCPAYCAVRTAIIRLPSLPYEARFFAHVGTLSRYGGPRNETRSYSRLCGGWWPCSGCLTRQGYSLLLVSYLLVGDAEVRLIRGMAWGLLVEPWRPRKHNLLFLDDEEGWSPLPPRRMEGLGSPWNRGQRCAQGEEMHN